VIEKFGIVDIILQSCVPDVGYHVLRKREVFERGTRECIIAQRLARLDRSNQRDGREWRICRSMPLLFQINVLIVQEVVVVVIEATLLSRIRSTRTIGNTCVGCNLDSTTERVKIANLPRGEPFTERETRVLVAAAPWLV
jgi:hypothetical protein